MYICVFLLRRHTYNIISLKSTDTMTRDRVYRQGKANNSNKIFKWSSLKSGYPLDNRPTVGKTTHHKHIYNKQTNKKPPHAFPELYCEPTQFFFTHVALYLEALQRYFFFLCEIQFIYNFACYGKLREGNGKFCPYGERGGRGKVGQVLSAKTKFNSSKCFLVCSFFQKKIICLPFYNMLCYSYMMLYRFSYISIYVNSEFCQMHMCVIL